MASASSASPTVEPLRRLLYRYWFWEWLFMDLGRARDVYQRAAAWRHNVAQRRHLPTYMRRWLFVVAANVAMGALLEKTLAAMLSAAVFYTNSCIAVCVFAVSFVGWLFLGYAAPVGSRTR
jgi:hypothetical protein